MQKFQYRSPRFAVDLPVQLAVERSIIEGRCRNISMEGMRLELGSMLPDNVCARVFLSFQDQSLELSVRVARTGITDHALEFVYKSDWERDEVAHLVASLAARSELPRLVLSNHGSSRSIFPEAGRP